MSDRLKIAIAQLNPTVGAIEANVELIRRARAEAAEQGADLVVCTELCVSGYPPEDLVLKPAFIKHVRAGVEALAADTADGGPALILGAPWSAEEEPEAPLRGKVTNAAVYLDDGEIQAVRDKVELPNYGVFDEVRVFHAGDLPSPVTVRGVRIGIPVCEDIWFDQVVECLEENGAELLVVINGSPFENDKQDERLQQAVARVSESSLPLIYANQVGGQDELVFEGASFGLNSDCSLAFQCPAFEEGLYMTAWARQAEGWTCVEGPRTPPSEDDALIYGALILGLRDYVAKNGFPGVIIGLSGGIDSALSAAIAVDALGAEKVHCVMMPSPYTSQESLEDAAACAGALGVHLDEVVIGPAMEAFETMLRPLFGNRQPDTTEENIQARSRGITLMALSNKLGYMVLSTGNKSEMSVGYATLYGDMCGGYNVLKDVYKTTVYRLARWRNATRPDGALGPEGAVIPERIITKAPSAELKPDQTDQDSLPAYDVLDEILVGLIEREDSIDHIVSLGHDREIVNKVWRMLETAEYKRRQAPPGVKITRRSFGRERRYPITNAFKGPL